MLVGTKAMDVLRLVNPMAKKCPLGGYVLYLDCLECERKVCKGGASLNLTKDQKRQMYRDKIDTMMYNRGYELGMIKNPRTEEEVRCYSCNPTYGRNDKVLIEVRKRKEFRFIYLNLQMCASLQTNWMSPIDNEEHFTKMLKKFRRSEWALRKEWGDL